MGEVTSGDGSKYDCTPGVDCEFGITELACMAPIGSDFLLSKRPDQQGRARAKFPHKPNFSREPGSGPYTINLIGQGVALTEQNVVVLNALMDPFASDGSFSTIKEVNYLWANSYWASSKWMWDKTNSTDLSREKRPEAEWPRADVKVIGEAFKLTNTTNQDPNIKWFVVGSGPYKQSIYPQIVEWGFDMYPCKGAESKGYPYCGPNSLYEQIPPGSDPNDPEVRPRSAIFQYYEGLDASR